MAYWEHLDLDDKTKNALRVRDKENKSKRRRLIGFLIIILIITSALFYFQIINKEYLQFIYSAIIGGFIGSSISFIINGEK